MSDSAAEPDFESVFLSLVAKHQHTKRQAPVDESGIDERLVKRTKYRGKLCPESCIRAGKPTRLCSEHGGESLCPPSCEHTGKGKDLCVVHGGNMLCPTTCRTNPGKKKGVCYEHGGWSFCPPMCEINTVKSGRKHKVFCREHGGAGLCPVECTEKSGRKHKCRVHGSGSFYCPESCETNKSIGRRREYCLNPGGSSVCPLSCVKNGGRVKAGCREHGGSALCPLVCNITNGGFKAVCCIHGGSAVCSEPCSRAGMSKKYCPHGCGGRLVCVSCNMQTVQKKGNMCTTCQPVATRGSRVREAQFAYRLQEMASNGLVPMYSHWNRRNPLADPLQCGIYRIDFVFELESMMLLLEFDEDMHSTYAKKCELVRQAEASLGYGGMPVHWIRYNPDTFKVDGLASRAGENERIDMLITAVQHAVASPDFDYLIKIDYICYNKTHSAGESDLIHSFKFKTIGDYIAWIEDTVM
jgi:hypothetical protein